MGHRTSSPGRHGLALAALLAFGAPALAGVAEDVGAVEQAATTLDGEVVSLAGRPVPTENPVVKRDAITRYQDNVYLHLIGQDKEAALGFYGLVLSEALTDPALQRDAEWQLAESLHAIGNVVTAEQKFTAILANDAHPFRQDAARNLLDLHAEQGDFESFKKVYDAEIVSGKVATTPEITYELGRSYYRLGEYASATQTLSQVPADSDHYSRAQYILGVIAIREGRVDASLPYFEAASNAPVGSPESRDANDLAILAQARLAYERSDFPTASDFYSRIPGDSAYLADILYETVWSRIKQDRYDEALKSIDLFLLAFPEHRYNGELRVIQGHLYMGCAQTPAKCPRPPLYEGGDAFDQALATYEGIVAQYDPVRLRFGSLASSADEPRTYFREVLTLDEDARDDAGLTGTSEIPTFAVAMMQSDPELGRALEVYRSLEEQRADLESSERMIAEIDAVLSREGGLGAMGRMRVDALGVQSAAVEQTIALLEAEARMLKEANARGGTQALSDTAALAPAKEAARSRRAAAQGVDARVAEIQARVDAQTAKVDEAESALSEIVLEFSPDLTPEQRADADRRIAEATRTVDTERQRLRSVQVELTRAQVPGPDMVAADVPEAAAELRTRMQGLRPKAQAQLGARIDAAHQRLDRVRQQVGEVLERIDAFGKTEYGRIQERFQAEVVQVAAERQDLDRILQASDAVSVDLTRAGFGRMESFFADSVLRADMGIIDVYWARKLELADERQRVQTERNALVAELERRFQLIRQKMEQ